MSRMHGSITGLLRLVACSLESSRFFVGFRPKLAVDPELGSWPRIKHRFLLQDRGVNARTRTQGLPTRADRFPGVMLR